jgi:1-acyl-sn-glycerol-3-phosphate acyltransferase
MKRAGYLRTGVILLRTVLATLKISIAVITDVYRGTYRRSEADALLRWWSRHLIELAQLRVEVEDPHRLHLEPGRPTILMSNHQSLYDIPLLFLALPGSIRMLTKKELFRVPIWGRGMQAGEFVSVDRHNHMQAIRDLAYARAKMEDGIVLWVAPEGTRSRDGRLGKLKKGGFMLALETGARIVPIGISGSGSVLPPGSFRGLQLDCRACVRIGRPIDAASFGPERRAELMEIVGNEICRLARIEPREEAVEASRAD